MFHLNILFLCSFFFCTYALTFLVGLLKFLKLVFIVIQYGTVHILPSLRVKSKREGLNNGYGSGLSVAIITWNQSNHSKRE